MQQAVQVRRAVPAGGARPAGRTCKTTCTAQASRAAAGSHPRDLLVPVALPGAAGPHRRDLLAGVASLGAASLLAGPFGSLALAAAPESIYDFTGTLDGAVFPFSQYKGFRYLLDKYKDQGFELVGIPCNQFGGQAPGTDAEERAAAYAKFGRDNFPVLDHMLVNGPDAHPLYKYLKAAQPLSVPGSSPAPGGGETGKLEWNYVKFLVDRQGRAVKRFKSAYDPLEFEGDVRLLLAGKPPTPAECATHPGRKVCNVDRLLEAA